MTDPLDAVWQGLPELLDRPTLTRVIGLKRHDVDRVFDRCRVYVVGSKGYVLREDARGCIEVREPGRTAAV